MPAQIDILLYEFGKSCSNVVIWVNEAETAQEHLDAGDFGCAYGLSEQLLARYFRVLQHSFRITEETLRMTLSSKPLDENTSVH